MNLYVKNNNAILAIQKELEFLKIIKNHPGAHLIKY